MPVSTPRCLHNLCRAAKVRGSSCPHCLTWQLPNVFYHLRRHVFSLCGFYFNGFNSLILGASCLHSCELSAFFACIFFSFEYTAAGNSVFFWISYLVLLLCWGAVLFCTFGWLVGWLGDFCCCCFLWLFVFRQNLILHCRLT